MKYQAKPVVVDAYVVSSVGPKDDSGGAELFFMHKAEPTHADAGMLARYTPVPGDYFVIQSDGYGYVNPKDVFERKYELLS